MPIFDDDFSVGQVFHESWLARLIVGGTRSTPETYPCNVTFTVSRASRPTLDLYAYCPELPRPWEPVEGGWSMPLRITAYCSSLSADLQVGDRVYPYRPDDECYRITAVAIPRPGLYSIHALLEVH
jgi:hypothetical protein